MLKMGREGGKVYWAVGRTSERLNESMLGVLKVHRKAPMAGEKQVGSRR